jgi:hypothetical protein
MVRGRAQTPRPFPPRIGQMRRDRNDLGGFTSDQADMHVSECYSGLIKGSAVRTMYVTVLVGS